MARILEFKSKDISSHIPIRSNTKGAIVNIRVAAMYLTVSDFRLCILKSLMLTLNQPINHLFDYDKISISRVVYHFSDISSEYNATARSCAGLRNRVAVYSKVRSS